MSCNSTISILAQAPHHRTSIPQVLARPSCVAMKAVKTMKAMKTTALHLFVWKVPLK